MENRGAHPLPQDLLDLLHEITERLLAHNERIEGGPPRVSGLQPPVFSGSPTDDSTNGFKNFNGLSFLMDGPLNKS